MLRSLTNHQERLSSDSSSAVLTEPAYVLKDSYVQANPSMHKLYTCLQNAPTGTTKAANSHKQPIQTANVCQYTWLHRESHSHVDTHIQHKQGSEAETDNRSGSLDRKDPSSSSSILSVRISKTAKRKISLIADYIQEDSEQTNKNVFPKIFSTKTQWLWSFSFCTTCLNYGTL